MATSTPTPEKTEKKSPSPARRRTSGKYAAPRRKPPRRRQNYSRYLPILIAVLAVVVILGIVVNLNGGSQMDKLARDRTPYWVDKQIIEINGSGRRGEKLTGVTDIVIHYVGNPGTTAQQNHDYYDQPETTVSSHFVIGLEGEVIQCIPLTEIAYASNIRNEDTVAIEVCHPDETGAFSPAAYQQVVELTAWLCRTFDLDPDTDVIRHYDVTEKLCPLYYVEHPDAWDAFRADVAAEMERQTEVS